MGAFWIFTNQYFCSLFSSVSGFYTHTSLHRIVTIVSSDGRLDKYTTLQALLTESNGTLGLVSLVEFPIYYPLRILNADSEDVKLLTNGSNFLLW